MRGLKKAELREAGEGMTTRPAQTGKGGRGGRTGGRGSASGTSTGAAIKAPSIFRRTAQRTMTGKLGGWLKPNVGPRKLPRRIAAIIANKAAGNAEAKALRRLRQPVRVRMERGDAQRVRVRITGMSQEQRNDYYAACEGKISWAQYRARWGHGPQLG